MDILVVLDNRIVKFHKKTAVVAIMEVDLGGNQDNSRSLV